ncbi:membrane protein [Kitasatospora sp. MMS16-BH015]|uniref:DUF1772 domain-containing protein n=1 Tax=Kitasatospora sp. MMS16-BH015 TaxID=2018025 RepID=UPI000CA0DCC6|nr:DUF1772 domain-containing protein [Kitasatospora sp. MMS16-BH015]AUG78332.1 membrane protein [Kitasatospora sp. MMS16-BH015]
MQHALAVVTVVVVGLLVGVEFAVAVFVNPIVDGLPHNSGLVARSSGARLLGRVMPFWYIGSVLLAGTWAGVAAKPVAGVAAGLLVLSVLMSVALLVPINSRAAQWTPETAPADWREQLGRWDRLHYVRVAVIVTSFVLLVLALA